MGDDPRLWHSNVARLVELPGPVKVVLMVLASRACGACGLTWPGTKNLILECGIGERRLQASLETLLADPRGLLRIRAYPKGGRGRATEYVVLPGLMELSPVPCEECGSRMKNPARPAGFGDSGTTKPRTERGVSAIPRTDEPQNPAPRAPHQPIQHHQPAREAREVVASPPAPLSEPAPPTTAQEALERVREMTRGIGGPEG